MKKLILILPFLFFSCDIYKKSSKTKTDTDFTEQIETKTFRKGDTVHYSVPNITFKDTAIYKKNIQGSTLKIVYDKQGNTSSIDCIASMYEESVKENRRLLQAIKDKDSEKKEEVNTTWIMYGFIMIGVVLLFAILMFYFYIKSLSVR